MEIPVGNVHGDIQLCYAFNMNKLIKLHRKFARKCYPFNRYKRWKSESILKLKIETMTKYFRKLIKTFGSLRILRTAKKPFLFKHSKKNHTSIFWHTLKSPRILLLCHVSSIHHFYHVSLYVLESYETNKNRDKSFVVYQLIHCHLFMNIHGSST